MEKITQKENRECKSAKETVKNIAGKLENIFIDITFAEEGELETTKDRRKKGASKRR
ncbi:MAG: hypothetical protein V3R54_00060 [Thermodesulfovibrionia bacterium]